MELWFSERHSEDALFSIKMDKQLFSEQSEFQRVDVFYSKEFGRVLVLDGYLMVTEKDEWVYHEMITHVAMATNPMIRRVLVIGAGDGGTVRELARYDTIEEIDLVEIDKMVIDVSKEYLPTLSSALEDARVRIYYEDGLKFVRKKQGYYDLIIVDSTDPFGPGEGLFTKEFYGNCYTALGAEGILVNQHESTFYAEYSDAMRRAHARIKERFPIARVYQAHIPTYPSGHWLFGFASKKYHPVSDLDEASWNKLQIKTKYYNTELHKGAFAIPNYVKEQLNYDE